MVADLQGRQFSFAVWDSALTNFDRPLSMIHLLIPVALHFAFRFVEHQHLCRMENPSQFPLILTDLHCRQ